MTIQEVQTAQQARTFLAVHVELNRHERGFICPLDKDVEQVFDPEKNKSFSIWDSHISKLHLN